MREQTAKLKFFKLPLIWEFSLIISISLGYFIFSAIQWVNVINTGPTVFNYNNSELWHIMLYELCSLTIIVLFLKWQGTFFTNYGFSISITKVTDGFILFCISYFLYLITFRIFGNVVLNLNFLNADVFETVKYSMKVDLLPLFLFSIFNPIFEEFILVGYIVNATGGRLGLTGCLILSVGFRLSYHIYQGPLILLSILPMGILFTLYYWHNRNILPLILAHGLMDFLSFFIYIIFSH